jgi:large subunit ribosomal protein L24
MATRRLKVGDEVIVVTGKNQGRRGSVQRMVGADAVIVDGVNVVKRHVKPNPQRGTSGGIVEEERPIHASNVMHFNPQTQKADRVGVRSLADGTKVRFYKSTGEVVDV